MNRRNILITGGAGRLGTYVIEKLNKHNITLTVVNKTEMNKLKDYEVILIDLTDKNKLKEIRFDYDIVVHLAGLVDYTSPYEKLYKVNVLATRNLVERTLHVPMFVHTSSTSVYGKDVKNPVKETAVTRPDSYYGKTKLLSEDEVRVRTLGKEKNKTIIFRPAMLYGKGFDEGYAFVVEKLMNGRYRIIGDGKNHVPILHAEDAATAYERVVRRFSQNELTGLKIMNLSCEQTPTQDQLIAIICKVLGVRFPEKHVPVWQAKLTAKIYEVVYKLRCKPVPLSEYINKLASDRIFDVSKAKKLLGFKPKKEIEEGIREAVQTILPSIH